MLVPVMRMPDAFRYRLIHGLEIAMIIVFSWILIQSIRVVQDFVIHRYDVKKSDNLRERKLRTQLQFIRRIMVAFIIGLTIAAVLLTFSSMRKIGTGLLTGVGVGGIIIGFAAQRSLGNLLAGLQIAFTQPIRIDDAVLVENEFGWIEDITLTYVVVRIWDERRLILPINYFIEKPFQNWTRTSAALLGTAFIYADYTLPIEPVRQELTRLLQNNPFWDGRVASLALTNLTDKTVELRALMSAQNSGNLFDLRCYIREQLMNYIKQNYPDSLPKTRTQLEGADATSPGTATPA
jgi:small-conductance mechanosensitive channel